MVSYLVQKKYMYIYKGYNIYNRNQNDNKLFLPSNETTRKLDLYNSDLILTTQREKTLINYTKSAHNNNTQNYLCRVVCT